MVDPSSKSQMTLPSSHPELPLILLLTSFSRSLEGFANQSGMGDTCNPGMTYSGTWGFLWHSEIPEKSEL